MHFFKDVHDNSTIIMIIVMCMIIVMHMITVHYMFMRRHTAVFTREAGRMFAGRSGATEKDSAPIACTIYIKSSYLDLQGGHKKFFLMHSSIS